MSAIVDIRPVRSDVLICNQCQFDTDCVPPTLLIAFYLLREFERVLAPHPSLGGGLFRARSPVDYLSNPLMTEAHCCSQLPKRHSIRIPFGIRVESKTFHLDSSCPVPGPGPLSLTERVTRARAFGLFQMVQQTTALGSERSLDVITLGGGSVRASVCDSSHASCLAG